ncbi:hypothetical protein Tsubulata_005124 [Turnera subulata]|uniref:Uncharacterized protein n=1 Tax=Turnera subulata TaxID=218843 RepID=A0A9Q0FSE8_9ROSI|nr:hypothetical protein Tsubulata_005124 [Turnera subulata]
MEVRRNKVQNLSSSPCAPTVEDVFGGPCHHLVTKRPKPHTLKNHSNLPHSIGNKDTTSDNVVRSEVDDGEFWQMGLDPLYLQNLKVIGIYQNLGEALRQICEDVAMISTRVRLEMGRRGGSEGCVVSYGEIRMLLNAMACSSSQGFQE